MNTMILEILAHCHKNETQKPKIVAANINESPETCSMTAAQPLGPLPVQRCGPGKAPAGHNVATGTQHAEAGSMEPLWVDWLMVFDSKGKANKLSKPW